MTTPAFDILEHVQRDALHALQSSPALAPAAILAEDDGDMDARILRALGPLNPGSGGGPGLALVVALPSIPEADDNLPGPHVAVRLEIHIIEFPVVCRGPGGAGMRGTQAALHALRALHLRGMGHYLLTPGSPAVAPLHGTRRGFISHIVRMQAKWPGASPDPRPPQVGAAWTDGALELSCPDPEAIIYFSTDGSFPGPGNSSSVEYSLPLDGLDDGALVRAAAWTPAGGSGDVSNIRVRGGWEARRPWELITNSWQNIPRQWPQL